MQHIIKVSNEAGSQVPHLGRHVNDILDSFGFPDALVQLLHRAYVSSENVTQFTASVQRYCTIFEAEMYWNYIVIDPDLPYRHRRVTFQ